MSWGVRGGWHLARVQELELVLEEQRSLFGLLLLHLLLVLHNHLQSCCLQGLALEEGLLEHALHWRVEQLKVAQPL